MINHSSNVQLTALPSHDSPCREHRMKAAPPSDPPRRDSDTGAMRAKKHQALFPRPKPEF